MSGLKRPLVRRLLRERLGMRCKRMMRREQDLRIPVPRPPARTPLTCRELTAKDLSLIAQLVGHERLPVYRERLRQGHIPVGALHQERLVGFNWANPHEVYDESTGIQFPLKPGEFYTYDKLVDPAFRNLGVGAQLSWERSRLLSDKGFIKKIAFVDYRNRAQRRSSAKVGSRAVGHLLFLQVFGRKFWLRLPMKRRQENSP